MSLKRSPRIVYPELPTFTHLDRLGPVVAIIGHGRSPERFRWGHRIDTCNTVIRMWDWAPWQKPETHGTRYDLGFFEIAVGMVETFFANKKRDPERGWLASILSRSPIPLPERTEVVDQTPWNEIGKAMGAKGVTGRLQFTRGTIAACWAIERANSGDEIVLVGFDNIERGETLPLNQAFSPVYQANPGTFPFGGYQGNVTKAGNHDFRVERPVLEYLAAQRGVKVTFAREAWGGTTENSSVVPHSANGQ